MNSRRLLVATTLLVGSTLLLPLGASASSPRRAEHAASPKALSLTLADVQHVYGASFRPFMVNTYPASHKSACGGRYTGGYLAVFGNFKKATGGKAIVSVESAVFAYPDTVGPTCAVRSSHGPPRSVVGTTSHTSSLGGLGSGASLTTSDTPAHRAYTVMVSFYRGSHRGLLIVSGLGGRPALADVMRLATVLDQRFQHAG